MDPRDTDPHDMDPGCVHERGAGRAGAARPPVAEAALEALLFDLDGTLVRLDRRRADAQGPASQTRAWRAGARRMWIATETPLNYAIMLAERAGLQRSLAPAVLWARRLKGIAPERGATLIAGCEAALRALAERFRVGIVTSRSQSAAREILDHTGLASVASVLISRNDVWRLKPHPAAILLAAERLGVVPERTAVVGDMPVDVWAARRAGARAIGVASGFCTERELSEAGAELVLPTVGELCPLLLGTAAVDAGVAADRRIGR